MTIESHIGDKEVILQDCFLLVSYILYCKKEIGVITKKKFLTQQNTLKIARSNLLTHLFIKSIVNRIYTKALEWL